MDFIVKVMKKKKEGEKRIEKERGTAREDEVMVLTADLHAAEGRIRGWLVTLGEGGGSRSSAHPEAVSTVSTPASAPTPPRLEEGFVPRRPPSAPLRLPRLY
ncbi:hypothetical protein P5V15_011561 [Pogonomyrmex californicus]